MQSWWSIVLLRKGENMIFKVIHTKMKKFWAKIKNLRAWQRTLLLITTYALIALIISSSILVYINNVFLAVVPVSQALSNIYNGQIMNLTGVPKDATCLSFSHDNEYYTYIYDGDLYIKDTKTNSLKDEITESAPITYSIIMSDRNIVIYFFGKENYGTETGYTTSSRKSSSSTISSSSTPTYSSSSQDTSSYSSTDSSDSSSYSSDISSSTADSSSNTSSVNDSSSSSFITSQKSISPETTATNVPTDSSVSSSSASSVSDSSQLAESSSNDVSSEVSSSSMDSSSEYNSSSSTSNTSYSSSTTSSSNSSSKSSVTTYTPPTNPQEIILRTYNIDNETKTDDQAFYANSGATIKQVVYSSLTNIIYVNTVSGTRNNIVNNVYKINIMSNIWIYSYSKVINNMVQLSNEDDLYFQDKNGYIYYNNSPIYLFKNEAVKLIGRDDQDNVYFESNTNRGKIYIVNDKKIVNTIMLTDLSFSHLQFTYSGIYAIYTDHVIDIMKSITKKINYDNQDTFVDIIADRIYLTDPSGQYLSLVYN